MLIRALIVLLVVLNLGVAAWWIASKPPGPYAAAPLPPNTPPLQLDSEQIATPSVAEPLPPASAAAELATPSGPPLAASSAEIAKPVAESQCLRFGPFAGKDEAAAVLARLGASASKSRIVDASAKKAKAWRVKVPPQADAAAAQAMARRITAAGFNDNLLMHDGANANAIALGVYRNRDGAEKRLAELQKAGFPAQLEPVGDEAPQWFADAALVAGTRVASAALRVNAPAKALDCAGL